MGAVQAAVPRNWQQIIVVAADRCRWRSGAFAAHRARPTSSACSPIPASPTPATSWSSGRRRQPTGRAGATSTTAWLYTLMNLGAFAIVILLGRRGEEHRRFRRSLAQPSALARLMRSSCSRWPASRRSPGSSASSTSSLLPSRPGCSARHARHPGQRGLGLLLPAHHQGDVPRRSGWRRSILSKKAPIGSVMAVDRRSSSPPRLPR